MKLTEKQIENSILAYLLITPGCLIYKHNNTGVYDPNKETFRKVVNKFIPSGASDLYGSFWSRATFIEVKTPDEYSYIASHYEELKKYVGKDKKKSRYRDQILFLEDQKKAGCIAFFADSIQRVKDELSKVEVSR